MPGDDDPTDDTTPAQTFLALFRTALADGSFRRLVLSRPRSSAPVDKAAPIKVSARLLRLKDRMVVSVVETHPTRDLTRNLALDAAPAAVADWLATDFGQAHLFFGTEEIQLLTARRGRQTLLRNRAQPADEPPAAHDRVKQRLVPLDRPYLQWLGVTDAQHRLVPAMARKWKQINKFVEVLDHALADTSLAEHRRAGAPIEVLDFGSGKGYLTFATHDHLRHGLGLPANVTGIDLKADMVALCNRVAAQVGAEGLAFNLGDVASHAPQRVDVMIALHACDTATDHAIHAGLRAGAAIIMCSPCCHKELRPQLLSPHPLRPILKHGVHLGQQAEMLTDGLRALLLEACGYDAQVFEFISPEQTSKNKMILAVRRKTGVKAPGGAVAEAPWQQVADLKAFYGIQAQCLETLLQADRSKSGAGNGQTPGGEATPRAEATASLGAPT